jgi:DNA-binding CsgD family transcriptional regulator
MDGPFTTEWATPAGVRDAANVILMRSKHRMAIVNLSTGLNREPVSQPELDIVGILAPHIRRALSISDLIDMKNLAADTFERMLDSLQLAVVAVDARFQVLHANRIASEMLASGNPLSTRGGKVVVPGSPTATLVLHEAISRAGSDETTMAGTGAGVPLRFADGRPAIAHVLPLRRGEVRQGGGIGAAAAIFIATPTDLRHAPIDALASLYGLTSAEARLLDQLADGKNRSQAAASLSIADSTAKTHLERIFTKTGASTQAELSRILASLAAPVMPA